jgi:hypothetical protein
MSLAGAKTLHMSGIAAHENEARAEAPLAMVASATQNLSQPSLVMA